MKAGGAMAEVGLLPFARIALQVAKAVLPRLSKGMLCLADLEDDLSTNERPLLDALAGAWASRQAGEHAVLVTRHTVQESAAAAHGNGGAPPKFHARILLVEDNAVNQKVATRMLERLGCRVDKAGNGKEAVEMAGTLPYDVIFMDCHMPEMDGYDATREIRAEEKSGRHRIIVAMTANALKGDREKCLEAGMDDYISKPIQKDALLTALSRYAAHTRLETPADAAVTEQAKR
jgi:CheY-like chemotaxis protein